MYDLILGLGGDRPGVRLLRAGRSDPGNLLALPRGHSVYAMDVAPERLLAAIGTRCGAIYLFDLSMAEESDTPQISMSFVQGAPVLAVCLLEDGCLASADTAGRCLLWRLPDASDAPEELDTGGVAIGSLLQAADGTLVGLSDQGHLCLWNTRTLKRLDALRGPAPSRPLALARLRCWPQGNALVYPADNGLLAICHLKERNAHTVAAHRGTFHAITACGEELLTFGAEDGLLKTWRDASGIPARTQRIPTEIISAEILPGETRQALFVGVNGEAGVFGIESDAPPMTHRLNGGDYRAVVGPSFLRRESLQRRSLHERACALRVQIQAKLNGDELEGVDELLDQLDGPGFEPTVLAIRAQLAAKRGDPAGELTQRHRLAQLLPLADGSGTPSLQRYAALLESVWQLAAAREIQARIKTTGRGEAHHEWITRAAEIMSQSGWVAAPTVPLPVLVHAAAALNRPFQGRWLLHSAKPLTMPVEGLSAELISAKYEQVRSGETRRPLPSAEVHAVWWLAPRKIHRTEVIILADAAPGASASVNPALRVHTSSSVANVTPLLLLSVEAPQTPRSLAAHHRNVLRCLEEDRVQIEAGVWPPAVRHAMGMAMRRLQNQAKARCAG